MCVAAARIDHACSAIMGTVMFVRDRLCIVKTVTVCDSVLHMGRRERGGEENS